MKLTVNGEQNQEAKIAFKLTPNDIGTAIIGKAPNHRIIEPSSSFQKIGNYPTTEIIRFLFNTRPWKVTLQIEYGKLFETDNEEQGLETKTLLTPDILTITLNFAIEAQ
jgi:hypothetical protein